MAETQPPEGQANTGAPPLAASLDAVGSKRQRRPSVRLGDIGDQPYDTQIRSRANKQWKHHHSFDLKKDPPKSSKTRPLINFHETHLDKIENLDSVAIGSWKVKDPKRRGSSKRVRSNWASSKVDEGGGERNEGEDIDDGVENSGSPLKEQSPIHSLENDREGVYGRAIRGRDQHDGVDVSGPSDNDVREWKSVERNERGRCEEDGVRIWLNSLGLGRYAPLFEIHEVDDEVLPMLTLEDLKDMGITAVGSRRKMYCAIQKLGKGFS